MPIYEYRCTNCGAKVEVLVRIREEAPTCPSCGVSLTEKLFSAAHVFRTWTPPQGGRTCCGREERCEPSPCSSGEGCQRER